MRKIALLALAPMMLAGMSAGMLAGMLAGSAAAYDIPSVNYRNGHLNPIWSNKDAKKKCPLVCWPFGGWTGSWLTTIPGRLSVCGCKIDPNIRNCEPGPGAVLN
jgi:hypothetical protein